MVSISVFSGTDDCLISNMILEDEDPEDVLVRLFEQNSSWKIDYSRATIEEIARWRSTDSIMYARLLISRGTSVFFMGKEFSDPDYMCDVIYHKGWVHIDLHYSNDRERWFVAIRSSPN